MKFVWVFLLYLSGAGLVYSGLKMAGLTLSNIESAILTLGIGLISLSFVIISKK